MYTITQEDIESITSTEIARGTDRFLPKRDDIPLEFWGWFKGVECNIYFNIIDAMMTGDPPPAGDVSLKPGFTGKAMKDFLMAHIKFMDVDWEQRNAGMAYALSLITTVTPKLN
jgi:hypothetical protein